MFRPQFESSPIRMSNKIMPFSNKNASHVVKKCCSYACGCQIVHDDKFFIKSQINRNSQSPTHCGDKSHAY